MISIYHNTRCGKSRTALSALGACGVDYTVIDYLHNPPTSDELRHLLLLLGKKPIDIIRTKEKVYQELYLGKHLSDDALIQAITEHPILLERPIVVSGNKAWIVRSEAALEMLRNTLKP
jgi:arsenate reductase (glutaredoxin)